MNAAGTAPDLIDPVIGFRQWRLEGDRLRSPYCNVSWKQPELAAWCPLETHDQSTTPNPACTCGIYAYYEPCPRTASAGTRDLVSGAVVLWGGIELHGNGMRAAHCRIVALTLPLTSGAASAHWLSRPPRPLTSPLCRTAKSPRRRSGTARHFRLLCVRRDIGRSPLAKPAGRCRGWTPG